MYIPSSENKMELNNCGCQNFLKMSWLNESGDQYGVVYSDWVLPRCQCRCSKGVVHAVMASWSIILRHQVMIMLKFCTPTKTLLGCWVHLPSRRFNYDWFSNASFLSVVCRQPAFFLSLYKFISGGLAHVLIHETTCFPSEFLGVTVWKCENAIVKVCHLTSAYFKSLLVKMLFSCT